MWYESLQGLCDKIDQAAIISYNQSGDDNFEWIEGGTQMVCYKKYDNPKKELITAKINENCIGMWLQHWQWVDRMDRVFNIPRYIVQRIYRVDRLKFYAFQTCLWMDVQSLWLSSRKRKTSLETNTAPLLAIWTPCFSNK